jgi:hypothetical protein
MPRRHATSHHQNFDATAARHLYMFNFFYPMKKCSDSRGDPFSSPFPGLTFFSSRFFFTTHFGLWFLFLPTPLFCLHVDSSAGILRIQLCFNSVFGVPIHPFQSECDLFWQRRLPSFSLPSSVLDLSSFWLRRLTRRKIGFSFGVRVSSFTPPVRIFLPFG